MLMVKLFNRNIFQSENHKMQITRPFGVNNPQATDL